MNFYVSGVDLIQNKETGEWYVLEVNSAPQFSGFGPKKVSEDVVKILIKSIFCDVSIRNRIFNICASQPVKLLDLLRIINLKIKNRRVLLLVTQLSQK